ncbi:hypothetical protein [Paraburkholderia phenoliruptrix]|uniref:hypothetical protein n=1 Tax=Paraburkholderia phenoliruptrix TaxID=252970 RepID=UPI001C4E906B|nr:hypothetical protein [Paraburkholderia phenoliruptrix]MBW0450875.1 hypothetical protein [Paraburkholderia phenoliruptrix]MBW9100968.1 hypothetical protein [Paraburkholderia phenoliruptrix]
MYSALDMCLAVLLALWIGASLGVIVGGINRSMKQQDAEQYPRFRVTHGEYPRFRVPAAHREFEHECDAPYPRIGD